MKFSVFLLFFFLILSSCNNNFNFEAKQIVKFNNAVFYPELIDTSKFEIFNYFDKNYINRFYSDIENFKNSDKNSFPEKNQILVVGSSSIRKWTTLIEEMQPLTINQRGFGGATIPEIIFFADDIVFPYNPSVIVFYCGENDHDFNNSIQVYETFQYFEKLLHSKLPKTELFFVSIKPSPIRKHWWKRISITNRFIKNYCNFTDMTDYIDVASKMFNEDFSINETLFIADKLHLNSDGYALWTSIIKPYLENSVKN